VFIGFFLQFLVKNDTTVIASTFKKIKNWSGQKR